VTRVVLKRLLLLPLLMLIFSITVFAIMQAPPGDFLTTYVATLASSGSSITAEQVAALRREYGLDQPIWVQYLKWMQNLVTGNLGLSLEYQRPNVELIGERLALTVVLAALAFIVTWVVAIPAGIYSATHPGSPLDYVFTVLNYVGVATPNFMLALVLMWLAFAYFGMSITGLFSPEYVEAPWSLARVGNLLAHIWLPAVVLGVAGTARLTRVMRANLLDELHKPYVTTARAKGLSEWRLVLRYPARLALNPLISTIGWYLPALFSGSLIVATVMVFVIQFRPGAQGQNSYAVTALVPGKPIGQQSDLRLTWSITPHLLTLFEFGVFYPVRPSAKRAGTQRHSSMPI
jgi:peptide/nickel transport system permease protein